MALRRFGFAALVACIFLGNYSAAHADSVFLLQLGSFPSEEQANQRWSDLKSKHSDILSGLALRIAQVALPPDNTVIYRTQAGPVESREDASKMCEKLSTTKDECFVVETAMFIGDEDIAAITPAPSTTNAPTIPSLLPAEAAPAPLELPTIAQTTPEPAPVVVQAPIELPSLSAQTNPSILPEPVDLVTETPPALPTKDSIETANSPDKSAPSNIKPQNKTINITDKDKVVIPSAEKMAKKTARANVKESNKAQSLRAPVRPEYEERIIRSERTGYLPDLSSKQDISEPKLAQESPSSNNSFELAKNAKPINDEPRELVNTAPVTITETTPSVASDNVANNSGVQVSVAEAIRVPLSTAQPAPSPSPAPKIITREPGVGGYPSSNPNFRTLWAQINYFTDQQAALTFWDEYRYSNPETTRAIRVRVTQPYYSANSGRVSLRMGPFGQMDDIRNICAVASARNLSCSLIKDIGSSASANSSRDRSNYRGYEESRRSQAMNMSPDAPSNWVQLGSYPTPEQAWNAWERFKKENVELLGKMGADVNTANMSSASKQVFRLRVGPFMSKMGARQLCDSLEDRGVSCVTVGKR